MGTQEFLLSIIKYLGLFIATSSSIWGATNIISKEVDGKKKLTRAGKISIILTLSGLILSIASNIIQDRYSAEKSRLAYLNEIKKTNKIILAGQPLLSLGFKLNFDNKFCANFRKSIEIADSSVNKEQEDACQGEMAGTQNEAIELSSGLFPLVNASLTDTLPSNVNNFIYLISLDEDNNSVLSYGYLDDRLMIYSGTSEDNKKYLFSNQKEKHSAGVTCELPAYQVGAADIAHPYFSADSTSTSFNWNLDIKTLWSCINKQHDEFPLNAYLPKTIKVAILYDFVSLPFASGNIATCDEFYVWSSYDNMEKEEKLEHHIYNNSTIEVIPNHLADQKANYRLEDCFQQNVTDPTWGEDVICKELLLVYERQE